MRTIIFIGLLVCLTNLAFVYGEEEATVNCEALTSPNGYKYNLGSLMNANPWSVQSGQYQFSVSVCGQLDTACNNILGTSVCQKWGSSQSSMACLGKSSTLSITYIPNGGGVILTTNGGSGNRQSVVYLQCAKNGPVGTLKYVGENTATLLYNFTLSHPNACPGVTTTAATSSSTSPSTSTGTAATSSSSTGATTGSGSSGKKSSSSKGGLSGGSIFLIVLACCTVVYFVGGIVFLKFVKKAEGKEIIPNVAFWGALPGLLKDGVVFTFRKITCRANAGYSTV